MATHCISWYLLRSELLMPVSNMPTRKTGTRDRVVNILGFVSSSSCSAEFCDASVDLLAGRKGSLTSEEDDASASKMTSAFADWR